jgi:hypothetical protein
MNKRIICSLLCIMLVLPLASFSSVLAAENEGVVDIKVKGGLGLSIEVINTGDIAIGDAEGSKTVIEIRATPKLGELHEPGYIEGFYKSHYLYRRIFEVFLPDDSYSCRFMLHRIIPGAINRLRYMHQIQNQASYLIDSMPFMGLRMLNIQVYVGTYDQGHPDYYQRHGYMELTVLKIGGLVIILN